MKSKIIAVFSCIALLLLGMLAQANPYYPRIAPMPFQRTDIAPAAAAVREGVDKLAAFIKKVRAQEQPVNRALVIAFLEKEVTPYFDFAYMARWAAGSRYQRLNDQQRRRLENKIKKMFYSTLANKLGAYADRPIHYFPPRPSADGKEVDVNLWVMEPQGHPIKITFRLYRSEQGWKIFDVVANNTSAVMYYRQYLNRMARQQTPMWMAR